MKNIKLFVIVFLFGMFALNAGAQQQERQDRESQQQQEGQDQEGQLQLEQHRQDRAKGLDQLPQQVMETLRDDYDDWRATEASRTSDPNEEEPFFMIKLEHKEEAESKVVMINNDGEVIDEEEVMILDHRRREMDRDRDRDYNQNQRKDDQRKDREGSQYTPVAFFVEQERRQERSARTDSLPQQVQSTIIQDFGDWSPTEAHLATDPEDGTFYYKIKMHNVAEGETKVVRISSYGEVIDEEKINPLDGVRDADRGRGDDDEDDDGWL